MCNQISQIRERIKLLLADHNLSINRIAGGNSSLQRRLHRQITEDVTMSVDTLLAIQQAFPGLNMQWLLDGTGQPFKSDAEVATLTCQPLPTRDDEVVIPVFSVEASANLNTLNLSESEPEIVGRIVVPNMPRCDGATYVRGDSMYPLLQSGDLIGFKIMPVTPESIFFGEIYLITLDVDGDRYLTVKYIYQSERGSEYIRLVSANPSHQPKDIHLSAVKALAIVKFTVRLNSML